MLVEKYTAALADFRKKTSEWVDCGRKLSEIAREYDPANAINSPEADRLIGECIIELRALCLRLPGFKQLLLASIGARR